MAYRPFANLDWRAHPIDGVRRVASSGYTLAQTEGRSVSRLSKKQQLEAVNRVARIRVLSVELDAIRQAAVERTRSIDSKSSFAVVAAGVLAGATFTGLVDARSWFLGLIPFALTVASVIAAVRALWPTSVWSPVGREVVKRWVDDPISGETLEDSILEVKTREVEAKDAYNQRRARATRVSFVLLIISLITALIVVGMNAALAEAVPSGGSTGEATPTPSGTP